MGVSADPRSHGTRGHRDAHRISAKKMVV